MRFGYLGLIQNPIKDALNMIITTAIILALFLLFTPPPQENASLGRYITGMNPVFCPVPGWE